MKESKSLNVSRTTFFSRSHTTRGTRLAHHPRQTLGCISVKIYFRGARRISSMYSFSSLFPKLFAVGERSLRAHRCDFRVARHWNTDPRISEELIAFVGRGLLKSNYSPRGEPPGSVFSGEPSMAKENNYPSAVRVSCGTRTIKINIGTPRPHLRSRFYPRDRATYSLLLRRWLCENYRSFPSNQFVFTLSATSKTRDTIFNAQDAMIMSGIKRETLWNGSDSDQNSIIQMFFRSDYLSSNARVQKNLFYNVFKRIFIFIFSSK